MRSLLNEKNCGCNKYTSWTELFFKPLPPRTHPLTTTPPRTHPLTATPADFETYFTWRNELLLWRNTLGIKNWFENRIYFVNGIAFQSTASPWEVYLMKGIAYATIILDETNCCCHGIHLVSGIDSITEYTSWTELLFKAPPPHEKST